MPRLDGLGLVTRLRSAPSTAELPIVVTTGLEQDDPRVRGLYGLPMVSLLLKPFSPVALRAAVVQALALPTDRRSA